MPGRHGADRQSRREQKAQAAAEAERAAQVARAERRLAQATGSIPRDLADRSRPARTPTPPAGTESPGRAPEPTERPRVRSPRASAPPAPPARPAAARPAPPPPAPPARSRPARYVGPPLAPAPREPLPISEDVYLEETPTDGFPPVRAERTLPPGTWMSFRG